MIASSESPPLQPMDTHPFVASQQETISWTLKERFVDDAPGPLAMRYALSMAAVAAKAQHEPHDPWERMGVT